jgi:hypothetical protein
MNSLEVGIDSIRLDIDNFGFSETFDNGANWQLRWKRTTVAIEYESC